MILSKLTYFTPTQRRKLLSMFQHNRPDHLSEHEWGELQYLFSTHVGPQATGEEKEHILRMIKQSFSYGEPLKLFRARMGENFTVCYDKKHLEVCKDTGKKTYDNYNFEDHKLFLRHLTTKRRFGEPADGTDAENRFEHIKVLSNPLREGQLHGVEVLLEFDGITINHLDTMYILVEKHIEVAEA